MLYTGKYLPIFMFAPLTLIDCKQWAKFKTEILLKTTIKFSFTPICVRGEIFDITIGQI